MEKKLIFDGVEECLPKKIKIGNVEISISEKSNMSELHNFIKIKLINEIIQMCHFRKTMLGSYKTIENLTVYYFIINNNLIILSFGEIQYGRYKMYLEGVWELE